MQTRHPVSNHPVVDCIHSSIMGVLAEKFWGVGLLFWIVCTQSCASNRVVEIQKDGFEFEAMHIFFSSNRSYSPEAR